MATADLAEISAAMNLILQDQIEAQFRRDVVLLNLLEVTNGRNDALTYPVKFDGRTAGGPYAEGADMSDSDFDAHTRAQAVLGWGQYRKGAKVSGLAVAASAASGYGGDGGQDIFMEEISDAIDELALELGGDMYAGNPSASPVELAGAALAIASSGTFATLAPGTYADWVAAADTLATADLSKKNLREKLHRPVKTDIGMDPEFVTCSGTLFDLVKNLADEDDIIKEVRTSARGVVDIHAAMGARAVSIDGVPYIEDRHATASVFYAWHSRYVQIVQVPGVVPASVRQMGGLLQMMRTLIGSEDVELSDIEARLRARTNRLIPTVEMLAQTGDAYKAQVKVYAQIKWKRRNAFAKLTLT